MIIISSKLMKIIHMILEYGNDPGMDKLCRLNIKINRMGYDMWLYNKQWGIGNYIITVIDYKNKIFEIEYSSTNKS